MFTTKEQYLAWTAQWKADYLALSTNIREYKAERKIGTIYERSEAQRSLHFARGQARSMLEQRKEAKGRSWAMKQATLAQK